MPVVQQQSPALKKLAQRRRRVAWIGIGITLLIFALVISISWWQKPDASANRVAADWHPLSPAGSLFTANFPGLPKEKARQAAFLNQQLTIHVFETLSKDITFVISYADFAPMTRQVYSDSELLSASRSIDALSGAKVVDEHPVSLGSIAGRERRIEETSKVDPMRAIVRVYVHGTRLYYMVVFGPHALDELQTEAAPMFDSFRTTN